MPFLPVKYPWPGARYKVYVEKRIPSKAHMLRMAKEIVRKRIGLEHIKLVDFDPAFFWIDLHGWTLPKRFKNRKHFHDAVHKFLLGPRGSWEKWNKIARGKWHFDLMMQRKTAPSWFGITLFRPPWLSTVERAVMGTVKGYQQLVQRHYRKFSKWMAERGVMRGAITPEDVHIKYGEEGGWLPPGVTGNPTKNQWMGIIKVDGGDGVLHRVKLGFYDFTYIGKKLRGRHYYRFVPKVKFMKESAFFLRRAKDQFDERLMEQVAKKMIELKPEKAPPRK